MAARKESKMLQDAEYDLKYQSVLKEVQENMKIDLRNVETKHAEVKNKTQAYNTSLAAWKVEKEKSK